VAYPGGGGKRASQPAQAAAAASLPARPGGGRQPTHRSDETSEDGDEDETIRGDEHWPW